MRPYLIITLGLAIALTGCYTQRTAQRQVTKAQAHHPAVVAALCGNFYPPVTLVKDSLVYKAGSTQYLPGDTVMVDCDTVKNSTSVVKLSCPPQLYRVDTFHHYSERQVENKGKIAALEDAYTSLQSNYDKLSVKSRFAMWWAIAATLLLVITILFRIYKPFRS